MYKLWIHNLFLGAQRFGAYDKIWWIISQMPLSPLQGPLIPIMPLWIFTSGWFQQFLALETKVYPRTSLEPSSLPAPRILLYTTKFLYQEIGFLQTCRNCHKITLNMDKSHAHKSLIFTQLCLRSLQKHIIVLSPFVLTITCCIYDIALLPYSKHVWVASFG